jgi:hypothetical protein
MRGIVKSKEHCIQMVDVDTNKAIVEVLTDSEDSH